jgi:hypothetical protein
VPGLAGTILGGGVTGAQPSIGSTIIGGGRASGGPAFAGTGPLILPGILLSTVGPGIAARTVLWGYRLGTSGLFWSALNLYRERGDLLSIYRGEAQTIDWRLSGRPARLPSGLVYGPVSHWIQPYIHLDITPKGGSSGRGVSDSSGSDAPAGSPQRINKSSRPRRHSRGPRYCSQHRKFDWCWTKS